MIKNNKKNHKAIKLYDNKIVFNNRIYIKINYHLSFIKKNHH